MIVERLLRIDGRDRYCPIVECDLCGAQIVDVMDGLVCSDPPATLRVGDANPVRFVHRRCDNAGGLLRLGGRHWVGLATWLGYVTNSLGSTTLERIADALEHDPSRIL